MVVKKQVRKRRSKKNFKENKTRLRKKPEEGSATKKKILNKVPKLERQGNRWSKLNKQKRGDPRLAFFVERGGGAGEYCA